MNIRWETRPRGLRLSHILHSLRRSVSGYTRGGQRFKIGITGNPERRSEHYRRQGDYEEMIVLYETRSPERVRDLEWWLVLYYQDEADNERGGGGGNVEGSPCYLYLVR